MYAENLGKAVGIDVVLEKQMFIVGEKTALIFSCQTRIANLMHVSSATKGARKLQIPQKKRNDLKAT